MGNVRDERTCADEAIAATFAKLTKGAPTKRELMLRFAYEDEIKVRELLILQLQRMVRRYERLVQCYRSR